ncbi:Nucleotidylyl transferase [Lepidopterella palustris CBS 459.81]|uniref:Pantoate--beta-alanine ligase n=1 Tax=Lepidopterella palustris CBS 459.81 TaxID=1314670 RepID=A0A8E2JDW5_9PEZI|nr:Nucleotidylyl transferase [Lepidopterella palustris CBS 459.81]
MARGLQTIRSLSVLITRRSLSTTAFRTSPSILPQTQIFRSDPPLRAYRRSLLLSNRTVGLVPTMGALHAGHLSLARLAALENTDVFVSIYINPTQFGLHEDLSSYPKTWDADLAALDALDKELATIPGAGRISAIFAPTTDIMYPTLPPDSAVDGKGSFVTITPLATLLEGASRPVFFRGVATVCMKLFNICTPERVYFGQKDVQQTVVIRRLVKDFHVDTDVRVGPTQREESGLAMSSRNVYLGARRRAVAVVLSQALRRAEEQYVAGKRKRGDILAPATWHLGRVAAEQEGLAKARRACFDVDYIALSDPETMEEVQEVDPERGAILSGAIKMKELEEPGEGEECGVGGGRIAVRLIDNIILQPVV